MSEELAIRDGNDISPEDFSAAIAEAHDKAKTLKDIVESQGLSKHFGGAKAHLLVEAWETIARGYGLTVGTGDVQLIKQDGVVVGASATAWVYDQSGTTIGRAEGLCLTDEPNWKGKAAYALAGMAQTRAASRALRQVLGWVVVLAGYDATPAAEMSADLKPFIADTPAGADDPMQCPIHAGQTDASGKAIDRWFKAASMRSFAHPNPSGPWCNLDEYVNGALETLAFERGVKESEITEIRVSLFGDTAFAALEAHQKLALVAAAKQAAAGTTGTTEDF